MASFVKPGGVPQVNWAHPLAKNLVACVVPEYGELLTRTPSGFGGSGAIATRLHGPSARATGTPSGGVGATDRVDYALPATAPLYRITKNFTFAVFGMLYTTNLGGGGQVLNVPFDSPDNFDALGFTMDAASLNQAALLLYSDGATEQAPSSSAGYFQSNVDRCYSVSRDSNAGTVSFYRDGVLFSSVADPSTAQTISFTNHQRLVLFNQADGNPGNNQDGELALVFIFDRALSAVEHLQLYANPLGMLDYGSDGVTSTHAILSAPAATTSTGFSADSGHRPSARRSRLQSEIFSPVAPPTAALATWGYDARPHEAPRRQRARLPDYGDAPRPLVNLARPLVFPSSLVIAVSTTQLFLSDFAAAWSILEGGTGGTITAGTGTSATYTAPASTGTFHVLATILGQTQSVAVTVVSVPANATIRLDSPFQLIDGFGCMESDSEPAPITDQIADLLYDQTAGIGFSIHRMGINSDLSGPRHDPSDFATTPWDLWWHVHKAMARNAALRVVCAPWTPPSSLKDNGSNLGGHLNVASYPTWANSLASFVTLAASQTPPVPIYALSPQNEPDFTAPYDSCVYSDTQMRDFIKFLGAALLTLPSAQRPFLMAPEPSDPTLLETYLATLEADPTALGYTSIYATHQYGHATMPAATRSARRVWMSEMSGLTGGPEATFDPTITDGIAIAKWVHSAITAGNVTAWLWLWGFVAYNGTPPTTESDGQNQALILTNGDLTSPVITQFTVTKRLYTIGHFSKWVRPGSRRYNIVGSLPSGVSATAYQDPNGRMVVVLINENVTATALSMAISGAPIFPMYLSQYVTSGTALGSIYSAGNMERQGMVPVSSGAFATTLPASSVSTLVDEGIGPAWDPVILPKGPPPRPAQKAEAALAMGPPSQVVPTGIGWQPAMPDVLPRRQPSLDRGIAAQAPVQPAAPVVTVPSPQADRLALPRPAIRVDQVLPVGPSAQLLPGNGWQPSQPDQPPKAARAVDRSTAVTPPTQQVVVTPIIEAGPDAQMQPGKRVQALESFSPQLPQVVVAIPVPQNSPAELRQQARRAVAETGQAPTQAVTPLPVQPQVAQPDRAPAPRRALQAEISAQSPTQPIAPLPVQPQVLQPEQLPSQRKIQQVDAAQAPAQPVPQLAVKPQIAQPDSLAQPRRVQQGETSTPPTQPIAPVVVTVSTGTLERAPATPRKPVAEAGDLPPVQPIAPVQITVQSNLDGAPAVPRKSVVGGSSEPLQPSPGFVPVFQQPLAEAKAVQKKPPTETAAPAPRQSLGFVPVFQPQPAEPRKAARKHLGDVAAQAPTQPVPPLPIQPQSAVHDVPLKPRPAARAEVATAPFQPPPPPPAPTFYGYVNEIPRRAAKAFDSFIQVVLGLVRPAPPTAKPTIFITGIRDSLSISGVRDSISISGVFGMPATNEPISIPIGSKRVIRWTYRQQPTAQQQELGQPGDRIPLTGVQDIIFTATRFHGPPATPNDLLLQKKLSRSEVAVVNPGATQPTDPDAGEADITIMPIDTRGEEEGQFFYDVKVVFTSDDTDDDFPTDSTFTLTDHSGR